MEEMILDSILKGYDFGDFDINKLEELKISMSMLLSYKKKNESITDDVLVKLKQIKEKNNQVNEVTDFKNEDKEI